MPGQKRKRGDKPPAEGNQAQVQTQTTEKGSNAHGNPAGVPTPAAHPTTPAPPNQAPPPPVGGQLQTYNVPQFNRERSVSPPPSPTSEAIKRRKLLTQGQNNNASPVGTTPQIQEMAVDDEDHQPRDQNDTPTQKDKNKVRDPDKTTRAITQPPPHRITIGQIPLPNWTKERMQGHLRS